ncbi:MAG: NADH-quinone oxidoreductase subunit C [Propionibacteriaceae bacterium]
MTWYEQAQAARDSGATWFCFLDAVDDIGASNTITVTLRLINPETNDPVVLKTVLDRDNPRLVSLRELWAAAGNAERAIAESFGVLIEGSQVRPLLRHESDNAPKNVMRKDVLLAARQEISWPGSRNDDGKARRRDTAPGVAPEGLTPQELVAQAYGGGRGRR